MSENLHAMDDDTLRRYAEWLGIPAKTLRGLRDGSLVAVPAEPTRAMRRAFHRANEEYEDGIAYPKGSPDYQWAAMLAAAQEPPR